MDLVYYPDLYVPTESKLKRLLLSWQRVYTLAPSTIGPGVRNAPMQVLYDRVNHAAQDRIVDLLPVDWEEKHIAAEQMFDAICAWRENPALYAELQMSRVDYLSPFRSKGPRLFGLLMEKATPSLIDILREERLAVVNGPEEILGTERVGRMYMSILAQQVRQRRSIHALTDDYEATSLKSLASADASSSQDMYDAVHLVTVAVPDVYIPEHLISRISVRELASLRGDLLPLSEQYHRELEDYQRQITDLTLSGNDDTAFEVLSELGYRAHLSFQPFIREWTRALRLVTERNLARVQVACRVGKVMSHSKSLDDLFDIASLAASFLNPEKLHRHTGLDYLMALSGRLRHIRMRQCTTDLIPKMPVF